jgi:hypothetical protein
MFVRDGRTLPYVPVTVVALDAIRGTCETPRSAGERRSYPHALAVYIALLELANDERADRVAVTQRDLAEKARTSRSAVQAALGDLQAAGVVEKREQAHGRARIENEYVVVEPEPAREEEVHENAPLPFSDAGVASDKSSHASARPSPPSEARTRDSEEEQQRTRAPSDTALVFDEWVRATGRSAAKTKLSGERKRCIQKALASHGLDDCLAAVCNIGSSAEARAGYGRGQRYDDVQHALSSAERIERWRDWTPPLAVVGRVHQMPQRDRMSNADRVEAQIQQLRGDTNSGLC